MTQRERERLTKEHGEVGGEGGRPAEVVSGRRGLDVKHVAYVLEAEGAEGGL